MSHIEAIYDDPRQADRVVATLRRDSAVAEVRVVELPTTLMLPLHRTRARIGIVVGAGFGVVSGLLAGALVAWLVGDIAVASTVLMLGLGSMLLGALAGALAFTLERKPIEQQPRGVLLWLRATKGRVGRVLIRLHALGARRIKVVEATELPELAPLGR